MSEIEEIRKDVHKLTKIAIEDNTIIFCKECKRVLSDVYFGTSG